MQEVVLQLSSPARVGGPKANHEVVAAALPIASDV